MPPLRGSRTEANLRAAFARESEANQRYLWFASQAEVDGYPEAAELFRRLASAETGHASGHLDILAELDDPDGGVALDGIEGHLRSAIAAERADGTERYPAYARTAREEGFDDIGRWMERLAEAESQQADALAAELESLTAPASDPRAVDATTASAVGDAEEDG